LAVQNAERSDPAAQQLIAEFCELVNYPYQQQQGQFAVGFYSSVLPVAPSTAHPEASGEEGGEVAGDSSHGDEAAAAAEILEGPAEANETGQSAQPESFVNDAPEEPVAAEGEFEEESDAEVGPTGEPEPFAVQDEELSEEATEAPAAQVSAAYEEPEEALEPPRPIPAPDADLDADLAIPDDDDLARLADELAIDDELDRGHEGHGQGRFGGRGSENGHS
jgi:hypothetical protein